MADITLEKGRLTFVATLWNDPNYTRVEINWTNYGNHCGDSSTEMSEDISMNDAKALIEFLYHAYPELKPTK